MPATYRTNRDLFSNHYLTEHLPETEQWREVSDGEVESALDAIRELYNTEKDFVEGYNEASLQKNFIDPVLEEFGLTFEIEETVERNARRPDYAFFANRDARANAFEKRDGGGDFYEPAIAVADAKRWGRRLDTRGESEHDFENPSYQIHVYLQETPTRWAVLTNGKQWRLYYGPTSHRLDSYYEIDLPALLEEEDLEAFRYFYLFFRRAAFVEDSGGDCFLDDVYDESNTFAEALGEDLQDNIYDAIGVLAEGFLEYNDDLNGDDLGLIHDSSLIYLYRMIFVLYAESEGRELLPTDNDIYSETYSLNEKKQEITEKLDDSQEHYHPWQSNLWDGLAELFDLINEGSEGRGIDSDQLYIPAYNGGLFRTNPDEDDSDQANFLASYQVSDEHLAEVIDLLTRRQAENGAGKVFVDYSSLDIRHLGSIYEGLLEYQLNIAEEPLTVEDDEYQVAEEDDDVIVEAGDVYMTTDSGERKATGSYYTPEYVVEYIVENTLGPLVEEIKLEFAGSYDSFAEDFAERIFELKVLDPAMGSGHFLTNAVDYLAKEIINAQERQAEQEGVETVDQTHDINWARRQVAQRCIYGVDLNPLATELAKVSLWLRTLAAEQPLAFLDHHLKTGNSLVGSDIETVLENGEGNGEDGQLTLAQSFDQTRRQALDHVTDRFQDLLSIDNETLADVKEMEAVFEEVRDDPLYQHLLAMANVHTADAFGLDVPSDAYERMAGALRDDSWGEIEGQDWFTSAQSMAADERFFHWELEFPVAYYGDDGVRDEDAGFDAVVGNPPYVESELMVDNDPALREYLAGVFETTRGNWDLYIPFVELSSILSCRTTSMIVPNKWLSIGYGEQLRKTIAPDLTSLSDFSHSDVFEDVGIFPVVYLLDLGADSEELEIKSFGEDYELMWTESASFELVNELPHFGSLFSPFLQMTQSILTENRPLREQADCEEPFTVSEAYELKEYVVEEGTVDSETLKLVTTGAIDRYSILWGEEEIKYIGDQYKEPVVPKDIFKEEFERRYEQTTKEKILISGIRNFEAAFDKTGEYISAKSTVIVENFEKDFPLQLCGAVLNSKLMWFYIKNVYSPLAMDEGINFTAPLLRELPFPIISIAESGESEILPEEEQVKVPASIVSDLEALTSRIEDLFSRYRRLNLNLLDYLGNYAEGPDLPNVGLFQPTSSNILDSTTEDYEKLQIERIRTDRTDGTVTISATARYKPENEDEFETDRNGYTETDFHEAFTLTDLTDNEAALIEVFVPVAVKEGGGIAGFRDNAGKTISLLDRLKAITLPDPDDVEDDLRRYLEAKGLADELDAKIQKTDDLIDEIVYELYDLTEEEIDIVESSLADP